MIDPLGIKKNDPLGLKKKVDSKPLSQEELWGSDSQPQDLYTSLVTGAQEDQQVSDGLGGPPKMKQFTGLTPEEQKTLQAKPAEKKPVINKEIQEKIIKAEFKPKEYRDAGSRLIDKLATGSSQLGATLATIPEYGYELSVAPQKFIAEIFNIPSLNPDTEEFKKQADSRNAVKNYYQKEVSGLKEKSKQLDQQYSQGVYDSFINGDYTAGFEQLTNSFAESLPTTAAIMVGGAYAKAPQILAASTMLFGTEKSEQLRKENPEITANARIANSLASGFAQAITETIGSASIGSAAKALVAREGEKKSISILKDGLIEYYKSSLKKVPLTASAVGEGVEEWSSQVAENAVDVATGVKPQDYNVFEGGSDALLGGVFGGIVFGAGLTGIKNTVKYQDRIKIKENNKNIFNLQSQLENQSITPEIKKEIDSKIEQLILENKKYVQDDVLKIESLPENVKEKLVSSTNKIDELTSKAKEINSSDEITIETKAILLEGLKKEAVENSQLKNSILNGTYIEDRAVEEVAPAVEQVSTTEVAVKPSGQKVTDIINRPATLESQAGVRLETPIEGDVYQEGQRVIFEDKNKKTYDLGNIDEVSDKTVEELGIKPQEEMVSLTPEGKIKVGGNEWNMQSELPNYGIEYDKDGNVKAVSLKDDAGKTVMYEGQVAEDAAYQVLLKQTETPEQRQAINEILENDEELNRQLREAEEATQAAATEVTEPGAPKTKAEQYSEELDKTKESDPEAYWSVSPVSAEDAAKGTIIDTPDGAAIVKPDGDIAGLFKKATSKAKGVAQDLLKRAIAAGGKKLDNFDTYLTPQYIKAGFRVVARVPFNEEYAPEGWNKEKHGTPDVVAMIYDPDGKLDIEEKTFDDPETGYDEAIAYRDSLLEPSIDAELEGLTKLFDESEKGFRMSQVDNAKEALKGILPGVKFIVHETNEAYKNAVGDNSSGTYIMYANGDRIIHINKKNANGRTVAHEVFHAVILDKIKGDKKVQEITARMVDAVYKTASPELRAKLDAFAAMYSDKSIRDEERLAELIGIIADGYPQMSPANKSIVKRWLDALAKTFGLKPFTDNEVIDLLNTLARKVSTGEVISEEDVAIFNEEGAGGFAGVFKISRQQKGIEAPKSKDDSRSFIRDLVEDVDIREFNGKKFITNMYDYTNAGETDLGNGFKINLFGGKGYVPYMMELNNKKIGDVSNLAAFNTQAQAETFIRKAEKSGAELFAPHSGTKDQSWQFQQHTFAELVDVVLDKGILTNKELIDTFNNSIKGSKALKETFSKFSERYGKKIKDFSSFKSDPKKIVDLLDIKNNLSPDLRKALNNSIASNKKFQESIGIKNKEQFYNRIMDPLNNGVTGGEIIGVVKFDPNTFKIVETKPDAIDHHPSFGYTLLAKINGIYQPTEFHKSYDVTDSYTKYNTNETKVSIKSEDIKFNEKNVTSSAGAIPKVAEFKIKRSQLQEEGVIEDLKNKDIDSILELNEGKIYKPVTEAKVNVFSETDDIGYPDSHLGLQVRIDNIVVPKLKRSKGIGSKEFNSIVKWAKSIGAEQIILESERDAIPFWKKMGFDIDDQGSDVSTGIYKLNDKEKAISDAYYISKKDNINTDFVNAIDKFISKPVTKKLQQAKSIDEIVRIAKEAKYSDAAISSFLKAKGFSDAQIANAMSKTTITEDEAYDKFRSEAKKSREEITNKKTVKEYLKEKYQNILKNWSNRQVEAQSLLSKTGMVNTLNLSINSHGYSGKAKRLFQKSYDKIYKGLSTEKRNILDEVIQAKRFIAIDNNRSERGLDPVKHPNYLNKQESQMFLDKLKKEIGDKEFNNITARADEYFSTYKKLLKDVYENGLISKESYDSMSDLDYQPRVFLQFVTDFEGDLKTPKNSVDSTSLSSDQIKSMKEGDVNSLVTNSEWLLSNSLVARTNAMAKNNINRRFMTDEFPKAKERFDKLDPRSLKGDDVRFYKYFKDLQSKVIDNPIIGYTKEGNPKYKYDDLKSPLNFTKAYYYVDGVQNQFFLEDGLHKSWNDNVDGFLSRDAKEMLSYASGSALVKAIATGNNPAFPIVNTPRDLMFTAAFSDEYSNLTPVALGQIGSDVIKSIKEIAKKDSDIVNKYYEYGGAMDFLSSQGTLKKDSLLGTFIDKMVPPNVKDSTKTVFNAVTLKKISEYSELMFRLGIFQRSVNNSLKELGIRSMSEISDKQQVDDIYNSAVASARGILDFNKGGVASKDLESIIPYINVAFQGGSVALNAFKKNPVATTSRIFQIATMASTIPAGLSLFLIASSKGDDDEDKTAHEIYLDAMAGVSKYQKSKYMNIVTGEKNEDGQYRVIKIAKAQELSPVISVTDDITENMIRGVIGKEPKSNETIIKNAMFSLKNNVLPIDVTNPFGTIVRNPVAKAWLTYQTGYDFFRDQPLAMGLEANPAPYEGLDMKSVENFYKDLGPKYGLSPVRSKAFVESLITTPDTNPFVGIIYGGAEAMSSNKDAKSIGEDLANNIYKSTGKRIVSYTSDFNRNLEAKQKLEKQIDEIKLKDAILKSEIKLASDRFIAKDITKEQLMDEFKDLDPFDKKRALMKIRDKKMMKNVESNIIDIKYEKSAKVKALMIQNYYGNILDKSDDSKEVIIQMKKAGNILTPEVIYELKNAQ